MSNPDFTPCAACPYPKSCTALETCTAGYEDEEYDYAPTDERDDYRQRVRDSR